MQVRISNILNYKELRVPFDKGFSVVGTAPSVPFFCPAVYFFFFSR